MPLIRELSMESLLMAFPLNHALPVFAEGYNDRCTPNIFHSQDTMVCHKSTTVPASSCLKLRSRISPRFAFFDGGIVFRSSRQSQGACHLTRDSKGLHPKSVMIASGGQSATTSYTTP